MQEFGGADMSTDNPTILRQVAKLHHTNRIVGAWLRRPAVVASSVAISVIVLAALFGPFVAPYGEDDQDLLSGLEGPSTAHFLGTDVLGRDLLSRLLFGARVSVQVGLFSVAIALAIGVPVGLLASLGPRWTDEAVSRVLDAFLSFPTLILLLTIVTLLGPGLSNVILAIGVRSFPLIARLVRAQALSVKAQDYVLAARAIGASSFRIGWRHVLPNVSSTLIVQATLLMGVAVISEASLSFLGVGVTPPTATWGVMMQEGFSSIRQSSWPIMVPGATIVIFVVSFSMLGDFLRDILDPRSQERP